MNDIKETTRAFPHLWWIAIQTITGLMFIFFTAPFFMFLVDLGYNGDSQKLPNTQIIVDPAFSLEDSSIDLITIFPVGWEYVYSNIPFSVLIIISLCIGLIISSVVEGMWLIKYIYKILFKNKSFYWIKFEQINEKDIKLRIWFNENPSIKVCWEWEYFLLLSSRAITSLSFMCFLLYFILFHKKYEYLQTDPQIYGYLVLIVLFLLFFFSYLSYRNHKNTFIFTQNFMFERMENQK